MSDTVTMANGLGDLLAPLLILLRKTNFFEAYVFIPMMTVAAIVLFYRLLQVAKANGTFCEPILKANKRLMLAAYFSACFVFTNAIAVALKTFIIEEMDYETPVWFLHLVAPLHIYIASVAGALLWLVWRNQTRRFDLFLIAYTQLGLMAGYYTAFFRLMNEPFEFTNVTTGMSGIFFILWFILLNTDIIVRIKRIPRDFAHVRT